MSKGVNKVIILGNLGNEPELRTFPDGGQIAVVSVATSESWIDKNTGQKQEKTEWHRVILQDKGGYKLGGIAAQYLHKGSKIFVEGKLRTREYTDKQGVKRYVTEIIADNMQMLDSKQDNQQGYQQPPVQQQQGYQNQGYQQQQNYQQQPPVHSGAFDDFDQDIPF